MAPTTATICKFVGTISLGLLTGYTTTLTLTTLPTLLSLPTALPARTTFQTLSTLSQKHQLLLSTLSISSLTLAYTLSPPRGKHPFLLWAALAVGLGYSKDVYRGVVRRVGGGGRNGGGGEFTPSGSESGGEEEWEVEGGKEGEGGGVNGEAVREGMERWRRGQLGRGVVWGVGWVVTVIGLWGDGMAGC